MPDIPKRIKKLSEKDTAFEKQTGKSHFSPTLRARRSEIALWCDQGKNEDQILSQLAGVSREELRSFMQANNLTIKQFKALRKK